MVRVAAAALCLAAASNALAQRMQFPTMVEQPTVTPATPFGSSQVAVPSASPISSIPYDPYASPLAQATPTPTLSPYPSAPTMAPGTYSPYAPSPYAPTPYSPAPAPSALYPEGIQMPQNDFSIQQTLKFMQDIRLRWTWLAYTGDNPLGVNDVETNVTFAVPFLQIKSPLMITPGFAIHFFQGPVTEFPQFATLPPRTYDAYLDTAWYPHVNNWFSAQLGVRVGAYTDFNTFNTNSIRIMGRGLGVVRLTPTLEVAAGVVYIDRVLVKILPAGGLIWVPNPDARWEILFPNPRGSRRWTTLGNTDLWYYITGEYGGGSWTSDEAGQFDYNDLRVAGGLESIGMRGFHAFFEVGFVWNRKIIYRDGDPAFPASDTVMLRAGAAY
jgi:hypothetical protein